MTTTRRRFLACTLAIGASSGVAGAADVATPSRELAIGGTVAQPTTYSSSTLQALPQTEVALMASDGASRVYRGVRLRDLIVAARPIETGRFDLRQSIVVARATDGYLAVFAWTELFDTAVGDGVLVAWSVDGMPLADGEGAFALVSAADRRPGPRHVRWLSSIELRRVGL